MNHCKPSILPLKGVGCCIIEFLDCTIKQGTDKYLRQRRQKAGAFFLKTTEAEPSAELVNSNATANWEATKGDAVKIGSGLIQLIPGIGTAVTVVDVGAELFTGKSVTDRVAEYVDKKRK